MSGDVDHGDASPGERPRPWDAWFVCGGCGRRWPSDTRRWRCECGGLFDLEPAEVALPWADIATRPASLWRYAEALPFAPGSPASRLSLGEGWTPLVAVPWGGGEVLAKVEFASPSLSFKDRGACLLVIKAAELGAHRVVTDSSGNAGTAVACYAARAGLACTVFVPGATSPGKVVQMRAHGADVVVVDGDRAAAAEAALAHAEETGDFFASHVYHPYFHEGTKTYLFEIVEQLGGGLPAALVLPVGNGTLLLGVARALAELGATGIAGPAPEIVAVQSSRCAPVAAALGVPVETPASAATVAEGIAIAHPPRLAQLARAVADLGRVVVVDDGEVLEARARLARRGLYVEPTAAVTLAALADDGLAARLAAGQPVVVPLCGAGLKSPGP